MALPHPALLELAAGRPVPPVTAGADALVSSAFEHRMGGLLWTRVLAGELTLPPAALDLLGRHDLRVRAHNLRLWRELDVVQARLAPVGVEVAIMKGVATEQRWYSRLGERPCNDLDLLLAPQHIDRISEVVALLHPDHPLRTSAHRLMTTGVLPSIDLDVDGLEVDLHADLLKYEIPTRRPQAFWESTVAIVGPGGVKARALSPEASLVHFLLHLNKDNFARLQAYADVARILAAGELDWSAVDDLVRGEGLSVHVYSALHEVVRTLHLPAPPVAKPQGPRALAWRTLWPEQNRLQGRASLLRQPHRLLSIAWTAQGRLPEAAQWWVRRRLLPPRALVELYYPAVRGPYAWRLARGRVEAARARRRVPLTARPLPLVVGKEEQGCEVVLVHYRGSQVLERCLAGLPARLPVVVVDNSAAVEPVRHLAAQRPGSRYVDAGANLGFAAAANLGCATSTAAHVLFLNPDCSVTADVIAELRSTLQADSSVATCAPALVDREGALQQSGGWQPSLGRSLVHALGASRVLRRAGIFLVPPGGAQMEVGWLPGACLLVRRDAFLAAGGFDATYFMYQEDMALGRQLSRMGCRQVLRGDLLVVHDRGGSSRVAETWLWQQRGSALASYINSQSAGPSAVAMRMILGGGFLLRALYHQALGSRERVPEMRTYARAVLLAAPEPPRPD